MGIGLMHEPEKFYNKCTKIINEVNMIIAEFIPEEEYNIDPVKGNVAFGSGFFGWAFTLKDMAKFYAEKFKTDVDYITKKLWGENYYDGKKFTSKMEDVNPEEDRGFNKFIMSPIIRLQNSINNKEFEVTKKILKSINITIKDKDWELTEDEILKIVFKKWLNAANSILDMCVEHLPSPKEAQKYRISTLFQGIKSSERKASEESEGEKEEAEPVEAEPTEEHEEDKLAEGEESEDESKERIDDDKVIEAMENCDPNGPTMIFISKLFPVGQTFVALGRIFSGTVRNGDKVKIYDSTTRRTQKKVIKKVAICMGKDIESVPEMPCGNILVLGGIDSAIKKEATIMDETITASKFKSMRFTISPTVEVAVRCKKPTDQAKLTEGLKKLSQSDPIVRIETKESGETVVIGSGDLHVDICINDLIEFAKCEIIRSEPKVSYRETCIGECEPVLAKSSNKHNRLWVTCSQLDADLSKDIEDNKFLEQKKDKQLKTLRDKYNWDAAEYKKVWDFGLGNASANCIIDRSTGVQLMKEIQGNVVTGFHSVIFNGPLIGEKVRQVKFSITDAKIIPDPVHRGSNQLGPMTGRVLKGAMLSSKPRLQEPIYLCTIKTLESLRGEIHTILGNKRGKVISDEYENETMIIIKAYLPVAESFGFTDYLSAETSGRALPSISFSHWETIMSDPYEEGSMANELVKSIRKSKGLDPEVPTPESFLDKL